MIEQKIFSVHILKMRVKMSFTKTILYICESPKHFSYILENKTVCVYHPLQNYLDVNCNSPAHFALELIPGLYYYTCTASLDMRGM